jgi:hypothetical protein
MKLCIIILNIKLLIQLLLWEAESKINYNTCQHCGKIEPVVSRIKRSIDLQSNANDTDKINLHLNIKFQVANLEEKPKSSHFEIQKDVSIVPQLPTNRNIAKFLNAEDTIDGKQQVNATFNSLEEDQNVKVEIISSTTDDNSIISSTQTMTPTTMPTTSPIITTQSWLKMKEHELENSSHKTDDQNRNKEMSERENQVAINATQRGETFEKVFPASDDLSQNFAPKIASQDLSITKEEMEGSRKRHHFRKLGEKKRNRPTIYEGDSKAWVRQRHKYI